MISCYIVAGRLLPRVDFCWYCQLRVSRSSVTVCSFSLVSFTTICQSVLPCLPVCANSQRTVADVMFFRFMGFTHVVDWLVILSCSNVPVQVSTWVLNRARPQLCGASLHLEVALLGNPAEVYF